MNYKYCLLLPQMALVLKELQGAGEHSHILYAHTRGMDRQLESAGSWHCTHQLLIMDAMLYRLQDKKKL